MSPKYIKISGMRGNSSHARFAEAFHAAGLRMTRQRELVFDYLSGLTGIHPTARQIYEALKDSHAGISVATVYNTLGALARLGLIKVIEFESLDNRYELNLGTHVNLVCTSCGEIRDLSSPPEIHTRCAMEEMGFTVQDVRLEYYGTCAACASGEVLS